MSTDHHTKISTDCCQSLAVAPSSERS